MLVAFQEVLDEALLNLATGVTSSVMTEPNLKASACSCECNEAKRSIEQKDKPQYREMDFYFAMLVTLKREKALLPLRSQLLAVAK